jgi:hypothetical protein
MATTLNGEMLWMWMSSIREGGGNVVSLGGGGRGKSQLIRLLY